MNYKYLLLVFLESNKTESYYSDDIVVLKKFVEFRKFDNYKIYELKEIKNEKYI